MATAKPHLNRRNPASLRLSRLVQEPVKTEAEFAETHLEIIRLLLSYGRTDVARRRLKRVVDKFGNTPAGSESRKLLMTMEVTSVDKQANR